jgi:hypothetical protein
MAASGHCHNPSSRQGPPLSANGKSGTRTSQSSNQWLETSAATTRAARSDRVRHHHNAPPVAAQSITANERHIKLTARPKSGCALIGKGNAFRQFPFIFRKFGVSLNIMRLTLYTFRKAADSSPLQRSHLFMCDSHLNLYQGVCMSKLSGGCLCGSIKYSSSAEPAMVAICNCTHCQKQTGTSFSLLVAIPKGTLTFTAGKPAAYEDKGSSGLPVLRYFCAKCGSPIYSDVAAAPQLDWLKAGTLDDTSWLKPTVSIWCDAAQPWFSLPDGVAKFPQSPPPAA